ncbi:9017_t:CDS:2 [Rhizophagus irregularis]|nr:9017_t:CDS:2 [Rhizophagus irregularis]
MYRTWPISLVSMRERVKLDRKGSASGSESASGRASGTGAGSNSASRLITKL